MRGVLIRCLVVLFTLMSISGPAHAFAHGADSGKPVPCADHDGGHGTAPPAHHHDDGLACCCDCLGCVPASALGRNPADMMGAVRYGARIRYEPHDVWLSGRAPTPDPKPPRPDTLT